MTRFAGLIAGVCSLLAASAAADDRGATVRQLIPWLLEESAGLKDIPFSEVILATSGKRVMPIDREDRETQQLIAGIAAALNEVLGLMNGPDSPVRGVKRVNEMSSHFETALRARLNAQPGLTCAFPKTQSGAVQRSGYPDLCLSDARSGRVVYLDPKLFAAGSKGSSLRTFYFEPKSATNKVTEDAHHLIIGIEHDKAPADKVRFTRWELIDLANFRVRLKAEFQGSNADLYRPEAVVGTGP